MDTESYICDIKTEDANKDLLKNEDRFKTREYYDKEHLLSALTNKNVLGKFKGELKGLQMIEVVGFKVKVYTYRHI